MRRLRATAVAVLVLAACGGESGDLLAVDVSGGPAGQDRRIVVTNDGRARCDGGELERIASERLIEAREIERDLEEPAEEGRRYPAAGAGRRYVARVRAGAVRWGEGGAGKPQVLARVELLVLQLGREICP